MLFLQSIPNFPVPQIDPQQWQRMQENLEAIRALQEHNNTPTTPTSFFTFALIYVILMVIIGLVNSQREERERAQFARARPRAAGQGQRAANQPLNRPLNVQQTPENLLRLYHKIRIGELPPEAGSLPMLHTWTSVVHQAKAKGHEPVFTKLMEHCIKRSTNVLISDYHRVSGLLVAAVHAKEFVRPLEELEITGSTPQLQFDSILQHLFEQYPAPKFLRMSFLNQASEREHNWYIAMGSGQSIRNCENLPLPVSRKLAHYFPHAPEDMQPLQAFRWAQVLVFDGPIELAESVARSWLGVYYQSNEFWEAVLQFLARQSIPEQLEVTDLLLYIFTQRQLNANWSIEGRSIERLSQDAIAWQEETRSGNHRGLVWGPSGLGNYKAEESNGDVWFIEELTSSETLANEGDAMQHCVGDYDEECASGELAIFSLRKTSPTFEGSKRMATIEVDIYDRHCGQISGKANSEPGTDAMKHISRWAADNGIALS